MPQNYWMIVRNPANYLITHARGFTVQGLKAQHRRKVQRIGSGDRILFYVSSDRRFTATATATSSYFEENTLIWEAEGHADWPYRIHIRPEVVLEEAQHIDANLLAPRLDYVKRWRPEDWPMAFQGNLHLLPKNDFLLIEEEMKKLKFGRDYVREPAAEPMRQNRKKRKGSGRRNRGPAAVVARPEGDA